MDDPFNSADETRILFEAMAEPIAIMFRALQKQGLTGPEAAALTAATFAQMLPNLGDGNGGE